MIRSAYLVAILVAALLFSLSSALSPNKRDHSGEEVEDTGRVYLTDEEGNFNAALFFPNDKPSTNPDEDNNDPSANCAERINIKAGPIRCTNVRKAIKEFKKCPDGRRKSQFIEEAMNWFNQHCKRENPPPKNPQSGDPTTTTSTSPSTSASTPSQRPEEEHPTTESPNDSEQCIFAAVRKNRGIMNQCEAAKATIKDLKECPNREEVEKYIAIVKRDAPAGCKLDDSVPPHNDPNKEPTTRPNPTATPNTPKTDPETCAAEAVKAASEPNRPCDYLSDILRDIEKYCPDSIGAIKKVKAIMRNHECIIPPDPQTPPPTPTPTTKKPQNSDASLECVTKIAQQLKESKSINGNDCVPLQQALTEVEQCRDGRAKSRAKGFLVDIIKRECDNKKSCAYGVLVANIAKQECSKETILAELKECPPGDSVELLQSYVGRYGSLICSAEQVS